jgi:hypothetical protein
VAPEPAAREDEGEDAHDDGGDHDDVGDDLEDLDAPLDDGLLEEVAAPPGAMYSTWPGADVGGELGQAHGVDAVDDELRDAVADAEHREGGNEGRHLQVRDEPAVDEAGNQADREGGDRPEEEGEGGIDAPGHEPHDDLDRDDRGEAEDVADGEVYPPGDDDKELGRRQEEDQDAVEEQHLQRVEAGETVGLEAEVGDLEGEEDEDPAAPAERGQNLLEASFTDGGREAGGLVDLCICHVVPHLMSGKSLSMTTATTSSTPTAM